MELLSQIPFHGLHDAGFEVFIRMPAEFRRNFGGVDGIAQVVARAVGNKGHEFFVLRAVLARAAFIQNGADRVQDLEIVPLVVAADVVGFAASALMENEIHGLAVIEHIEPVADVRAVAVHRNGLFREAL